jgi:hypothetical protein
MKVTKRKAKKQNQNSLLSFKGLPFEGVISDLLKVKPEPKKKTKKKEK